MVVKNDLRADIAVLRYTCSEIISVHSTQTLLINRAHAHLWKHVIRQDRSHRASAKHEHGHSLCASHKSTLSHTHILYGPVHKDLSFYQREPHQENRRK